MQNDVQDKRPDHIGELHRQRQLIRRVSVGVLLATGVFALVSCEGLTRRGAASDIPTTSQSLPLKSAVAGTAVERRA